LRSNKHTLLANSKSLARCIAPLAIALPAIMPASVYAQSIITLYGQLDMGFNYKTAAGADQQTGKSASAISLVSGNDLTSRWGLLGYEDLGGGMKATFRLESGFNMATGAGNFGLPLPNDTNSLFDRGASVGLVSPYGTVLLGRVATPLWDSMFVADAAGFFNFGALSTVLTQNLSNVNPALGLAGKTTGTYSVSNGGLMYLWLNNSVKYLLPQNAYGFTGSLLYSFGGTAGSFKNRSARSAALNWTGGNLSLISAYYDAADPGGLTNNTWLRAFTLGAVYNVGPVKAGFDFTKISNPTTGANQNFYYTSASWQVTPSVSLLADWIHLDDLQNQQGNGDLYKVSVEYSLSKSSTLYSGIGYSRNQAQGILGVGSLTGPLLAPAVIGHNQLAIVAGIRKWF
jgi:predicted porin